MSQPIFMNTFRNLPIPVIVFRDGDGYPLSYVNPDAQMLFCPQMTIHQLQEDGPGGLGDILRFPQQSALPDILETVKAARAVFNYPTQVLSHDGQTMSVLVTASLILAGGRDYIALYFFHGGKEASPTQIMYDAALMEILIHAAHETPSAGEAIDRILRVAGLYTQVSRVYIFEEVSQELTRNTYEWCAEGVDPAIQGLQELQKADYNYDAIVEGGVYIANDVRELPQSDRDILTAQGIKSLAILPMFHAEKALGYIGFDACESYRKWTGGDIATLKVVAEVVSSLIVRRKAEEKAARSLDILQTISDNVNSVIYVNTLDTYELVFVNKSLLDNHDARQEELLGKPCWQMLQAGMTGPCEFCPIPKMLDGDGNPVMESYVWEFKNTLNKKWYLVKDSIIKWVDGRNVHIETAIEITIQKQYEKKLEYFASTDTMTGAYNREWGHKILQEQLFALRYTEEPISLCFLDLDGLKQVNDTFGHDAGDDMIVSIAKAIRSCIRSSDLFFRWGGDEFILLLRCDPGSAELVVSNIKKRLSEINLSAGRPYELSFSYGVAAFGGGQSDSVDNIVNEADRNMYRNKMQKRRGRSAEPGQSSGH